MKKDNTKNYKGLDLAIRVKSFINKEIQDRYPETYLDTHEGLQEKALAYESYEYEKKEILKLCEKIIKEEGGI